MPGVEVSCEACGLSDDRYLCFRVTLCWWFILSSVVGRGASAVLDEHGLADVREETDLDSYSDDELRAVAEALCSALSDASNGDDDFDEMIAEAWSEAGTDEIELAEIVATLGLVEAACPEPLTPELAADNEPIPISFTLVGDSGEEFLYSAASGCRGEGGTPMYGSECFST